MFPDTIVILHMCNEYSIWENLILYVVHCLYTNKRSKLIFLTEFS